MVGLDQLKLGLELFSLVKYNGSVWLQVTVYENVNQLKSIPKWVGSWFGQVWTVNRDIFFFLIFYFLNKTEKNW